MKKLFTILVCLVLVSCTGAETPVSESSTTTQTGAETQTQAILTPEEVNTINETLKEYEQKLRETGQFSEDIINQALKQTKEKLEQKYSTSFDAVKKNLEQAKDKIQISAQVLEKKLQSNETIQAASAKIQSNEAIQVGIEQVKAGIESVKNSFQSQ